MAKKRNEEPKGGLPGWMATYGDLVTLLLCFFILLFSMSSVDVTKYKAVAESFEGRFGILHGGKAVIDRTPVPSVSAPDNKPTATPASGSNTSEYEKATQISNQIKQYLVQSNMDQVVLVSHTSNYVKLTFAGDLLFDSGEATIAHGEKVLETINQIMIKGGYTKYMLNIKGHTDNVPMNSSKYPSNWYLSSARAIAVGEELMKKYNYNATRISCTGYGQFKPIATNTSEEGRAKNRRVEFEIRLDDER